MSAPSFRIASACLSLSFIALTAHAAFVTDNNLTVTALPDYANTSNDLVSESISLNGNGLYAISTTIASTQSGHDMSPYYIAGISLVTPAASTGDLISSFRWGRTYGDDYPATTSSIVFANTAGASTAYYNLGIGRFDHLQAANYRWQTSGNTLYGAAGTDGNLVPNASFENSDANFFLGGAGEVVAGGVHGNNAWQINGSTSSYLAVPVTAGVTYQVSFWFTNVTSGSAQYEYGFSKPENGFATGVANTGLNINGLAAWTEVVTTFTPDDGQATWYLGGMSNTGVLQFDSIYVGALIPEPATAVTFLGGAALLIATVSRRRKCN